MAESSNEGRFEWLEKIRRIRSLSQKGHGCTRVYVRHFFYLQSFFEGGFQDGLCCLEAEMQPPLQGFGCMLGIESIIGFCL